MGELSAAAEAYTESMHLRRELGQDSLAIDDLAGLARLAMDQDNTEQALAQVEEILAWIETNGLDGIEYPLQVYLTCYHILSATANDEATAIERANDILTKAHTALLERADDISDAALQRKFLENVKTNREIVSLWAANES
jgi:hypothetical protein